jgi:UDP-glucuronate decarboxylase
MDQANLTKFYRGKRILVTGGAGFLGSFLCERLLGARAEVLCVDKYFTGRRANIAHLIGNPMFEAMRHDVTVPLFVEVLTQSLISPVPLRRFTISSIP